MDTNSLFTVALYLSDSNHIERARIYIMNYSKMNHPKHVCLEFPSQQLLKEHKNYSTD